MNEHGRSTACHDAGVASRGLDRDQLIGLVQRIMCADAATEIEHQRLIELFEDRVPHPEASDLIYYPDRHFDGEPTPEQVVDAALAYRAIELGPGSEA